MVKNSHNLSENSSVNSVPKHVAIIMDGNGRWAKQHNLPRAAGHRAGVKSVRKVIKLCVEMHIPVLTLFAFGSENWQRPKQEVNYLLDLFILVLRDEIHKLNEQNIKLQVIGDRSRFDQKLQKYIAQAEQLTQDNTGLHLLIAASYSGQWDIVQATKHIANEVAAGKIEPSQITPEYFAQHLTTGD
ncbi:MAG: di-trans,poly-cis-decaprenylcistransferase, partial [Gammaproteobacteria bacterium]|nr:di-trans,poly-cis-decaprenylcistransferase [Gammaproteobacteria bacterium]